MTSDQRLCSEFLWCLVDKAKQPLSLCRAMAPRMRQPGHQLARQLMTKWPRPLAGMADGSGAKLYAARDWSAAARRAGLVAVGIHTCSKGAAVVPRDIRKNCTSGPIHAATAGMGLYSGAGAGCVGGMFVLRGGGGMLVGAWVAQGKAGQLAVAVRGMATGQHDPESETKTNSEAEKGETWLGFKSDPEPKASLHALHPNRHSRANLPLFCSGIIGAFISWGSAGIRRLAVSNVLPVPQANFSPFLQFPTPSTSFHASCFSFFPPSWGETCFVC